MPVYQYYCEGCDTDFDRYLPFYEHVNFMKCDCGVVANQVITPITLIKPRTVHYDSPIDGAPITSEAARREDLARNDCIEYEPGMREDADARVIAEEKQLDKSIDQTMDAEIHKMPSRKKEQLAAELSAGANPDVVRSTVDPT